MSVNLKRGGVGCALCMSGSLRACSWKEEIQLKSGVIDIEIS